MQNIEELYSHYSDTVFTYLFFRLGDERKSEALTRRVFRRIHENGLPASETCSVKSQLLRTAHHTANEAVWKRRIKQALMQKTDPSPRNADEQDSRRFLLATLAKLPSEDRELFLLCRVLNCTTKEAAVVTRKPELEVKTALPRACAAFRKEVYEKEGFFHESCRRNQSVYRKGS